MLENRITDSDKSHQEELLMSAWINQMNSIWSIHQHVVVVEIATLTALYFLMYKHEPLSNFFLMASLVFAVNIILHLCLMAVRRHAQLLSNYETPLHHRIFPKARNHTPSLMPWANSKILKVGNHVIARLTIFVIIWINTLILIVPLTITYNWGLLDLLKVGLLGLNLVIPICLTYDFNFKVRERS